MTTETTPIPERTDRLYILIEPDDRAAVKQYNVMVWKIGPMEYRFAAAIPNADTPQAVIEHLQQLDSEMASTGPIRAINWCMRPGLTQALMEDLEPCPQRKDTDLGVRTTLRIPVEGKLEYLRRRLHKPDGSRSYLFVLRGNLYIESFATGCGMFSFAFCRPEVFTDFKEVMELPEREREDMLWLNAEMHVLNKQLAQ